MGPGIKKKKGNLQKVLICYRHYFLWFFVADKRVPEKNKPLCNGDIFVLQMRFRSGIISGRTTAPLRNFPGVGLGLFSGLFFWLGLHWRAALPALHRAELSAFRTQVSRFPLSGQGERESAWSTSLITISMWKMRRC